MMFLPAEHIRYIDMQSLCLRGEVNEAISSGISCEIETVGPVLLATERN